MTSPGLYLHLPFCTQKCFYCNFVITLNRTDDSRKRFFSALEKEIRQAAEKYGRLKFKTLYLGGGTPSLLTPEEMTCLVELLKYHFDFLPGFEFTCEFNPGDVSVEKMKIFRGLGINRVSLGTQAFQDRLLKEMGREHGVVDIEKTVNLMREYGIENISFDLISGLPGQTLADFRESLEKTVSLAPKQLSLYDLELHEKTPWGIQYKKGTIRQAPEDLRAEMFQAAIDIMTAAGYAQYEISTFAKPGFESRHNLIYWNNQEYLGLGPGAFTYMKGVRSQFSLDVPDYLQKCETGDWEPAVKDVLSDEEKETETLVTGLRLSPGVDLDHFSLIRPELEKRLLSLEEAQLLTRSGSRITLTGRGRFLAERTFTFLVGK
jgi:oxygen-independent coproporphyrinogen III oxidase